MVSLVGLLDGLIWGTASSHRYTKMTDRESEGDSEKSSGLGAAVIGWRKP